MVFFVVVDDGVVDFCVFCVFVFFIFNVWFHRSWEITKTNKQTIQCAHLKHIMAA